MHTPGGYILRQFGLRWFFGKFTVGHSSAVPNLFAWGKKNPPLEAAGYR